ncbi:MAG: hypothetical protein K6E78_00070 [Treponema sp.]|nr:hypothetical protein [Treponema sp.]
MKKIKTFCLSLSALMLSTALISCGSSSNRNFAYDEITGNTFSSYKPSETSGVMFQAYSWESHKKNGTWWTTIANHGDEIGETFEYAWFPPVSKSGDPYGYLPQEWKNYSSNFGNESGLKNAISAIAPCKPIADIVINHRVGSTSYGDFKKPELGVVKNQNYMAICSTDEGFTKETNGMASVPLAMRGAPDTGDDFNGGRDLDHTNPDVQAGIVEWMNELNDMGFVGWRYDYVRGYSAKYNGYYNAMARTEFSVGELWVDNNNLVPLWIKDSGNCIKNVDSVPSRAFDFATKNALNNVFGGRNNNNYKEMNASMNTSPIQNKNYAELAGSDLLFRKMPAWAVTFVDNHDTGSTQSMYAIDRNDLGAAYAFILTHPGIPCVAWQHYFTGTADSTSNDKVSTEGKTLHDHIKDLVALRKSLEITNVSKIEILKKDYNTYAAKITGKKGSLITTIGSSLYSCPSGYTTKYTGINFAIYVSK